MNHNWSEYHLPVGAGVHYVDVIFVKEEDNKVNPLDVKGTEAVGFLGVAAAIANAVFNATSKCVRNLPVGLDELL